MTADLRALAEAATPGPWIVETPESVYGHDGGEGWADLRWVSDAATVGDDDPPWLGPMLSADAAYIAAANPAAVLALLDERDALEAEVDRLRDAGDPSWHLFDLTVASTVDAERDALRAEVERLRAETFRHDMEAEAAIQRATEAVKRAKVEVALAGKQRDEARAAIQRVRALHVSDEDATGPFCAICETRVPCATIRALDVTP